MIKGSIFSLVLCVLVSCKNPENSDSNLFHQNENTFKLEKNDITNPAFPIENIFGIWTKDPTENTIDFELTEKSFFVLDQNGDGNLPYKIDGNKIIVKYPKSLQSGLIKKAKNDSLIIYWASGEYSIYKRWK